MSYHSDAESETSNQQQGATPSNSNQEPVDNNVDEDTLRVMISTDNHLGYAEKDPIRGNDSFAAFEEVLLLAKRHHCDMVLLAGDLFHENKPSRRTLHKTLTILRRHTMGPNPVSFQIISDQANNFRSSIHQTVNYEDPYTSVDLPIFSIHGNHDDPTRDGGTEMLAALDLLACANLVNYFGRQDEVDKVVVSPVLMKKGDTKVALYGIGSMRDERLNRMWQGKKVRFLKPDENNKSSRRNGSEDESEEDPEDEDENSGWFNIFALHQNRDAGRGSKNCVHDSMIPEWMDLVVWGHEHECLITPSESSVGTFRITQPGSSVATSLTEGESMRKHVGILDVRGNQFRMVAVPLMNVRSFAVGTLTLSEHTHNLDPEDPRIDDQMTKLLSREVKKLIQEAREDSRLLRQDVDAVAGNGDNSLEDQLQFRVDKAEQVLVRLKVEHSGFSTLHNQRFGSLFVKEVANPSDILLFHRRRSTDAKSSKKKKSKDAEGLDGSSEPIYPADIEDVNIEDIVRDTLDNQEKKMMILDESRLSIAVEDYVVKETKATIGESVKKMITGQRKLLVRRGHDEDEDEDATHNDGKLKTVNAVREMCQSESQRQKGDDFDDMDIMEDEDETPKKKRASAKAKPKAAKKGRGRMAASTSISDDSDIEMMAEPAPMKKAPARTNRTSKLSPSKTKTASRARKTTATTARSRTGTVKKKSYNDSDDDFDNNDNDESIEEVTVRKRAAPKRKTGRAATLKQKRYKDDDDDDIVDDDSDIEVVERPSTKSRASSSKKRGRGRTSTYSYAEDDDDQDDDWGTASSSLRSPPSQRSRRR
eukprot:CAMPEP_0194116684 /NCGR_PEP_ID=MMETSP0150-20130528/28215_1 /TAXON_ID=122233 /ORGANISM="Chaetoceros debilis, Strain MM31A-1" /LENGTH=817 /DNA_ID=CAMNT_0038807463 /DNA_START=62 /DNA_END=2515 /DNA_ORIENTATION=+